MIINGKSVRGIYIYNENSEYEKGDFVVDGDCIFICTANSPTDTTNFTVKGQKPILNGKINFENYKAYPGDLIQSADEYYKIVKNNGNSDVEDKYVSSYALCEILRKMYFGINESGIVTDHVLYSPENNTVDYSVGDKTVNEYLESTTEVLTKIILEPDLNNGTVLVSKNLPEIKNLFVTEESENEESYYDGHKNIVLLRQYTYIEDMIKWRVQELTDPVNGESYYRYLKSKINEGEIDAIDGELLSYSLAGGYVSAWKSNFGGGSKKSNGSRRIIEKLNSIQLAYSERLDDYENKLNNLENSFRFRCVSGNLITGSEGKLVTVTCICKNDSDISSVRKSFSITVPLKNGDVYYLGKDGNTTYYLRQTANGNNYSFTIVNSPTSTDIIGDCKVVDIYYREEYNRESITI